MTIRCVDLLWYFLYKEAPLSGYLFFTCDAAGESWCYPPTSRHAANGSANTGVSLLTDSVPSRVISVDDRRVLDFWVFLLLGVHQQEVRPQNHKNCNLVSYLSISPLSFYNSSSAIKKNKTKRNTGRCDTQINPGIQERDHRGISSGLSRGLVGRDRKTLLQIIIMKKKIGTQHRFFFLFFIQSAISWTTSFVQFLVMLNESCNDNINNNLRDDFYKQ